MTKRKGEERLERQVPSRFQLRDGGDVKRNHCVPECVVEMYDEIFHEWLTRWTNPCIHPHIWSKG